MAVSECSVRASALDVTWDPAGRLLQVHPAQTTAVTVQVSVANVQGISKVVLTLTAPADYTIVKETSTYGSGSGVPFAHPMSEPRTTIRTLPRPHSSATTSIQLTAPDVVGDAYRLENPFRIVLDLRKGAASGPGTPQQLTSPKPVGSPRHPHHRHRPRPRR